MEIYIGIDPSINSTGMTVQACMDDGTVVSEKHYIITGERLTKRQVAAEESLTCLEYVKYEKLAVNDALDNHGMEYNKTMNFMRICEKIREIIATTCRMVENVYSCNDYRCHIVQEGISYGSTLRTRSVFDLSGLNYMIRMSMMQWRDNVYFVIATPGEVKKFATGKGNANKDAMVSMFLMIKPELDGKIPKVDDIADSYFMCEYAKRIWKEEE